MTYTFLSYSEVISAHPGPAYFLAAPNVRLHPTWFLPGLPSYLHCLSGVLHDLQPNLHTLRSFGEGPSDLDSDGIHFNAASGRDYVQFLLDQPP